MWKKIRDPLGPEQEALNSSSILAMEPEPALTTGYKECLFLQVFYLTHAYGVENLRGCGQNFACLLDLLGFAYFGSDMSLAY